MKQLTNYFNQLTDWCLQRKIYARILFWVAGFSSIIWFLIRVIPKPQRAAYPCMRAAAPVMSGFVIYLLTLTASFTAYQKTKKFLNQRKFPLAFIFLGITLIGVVGLMFQHSENIFARTKNVNWDIVANQPIGKARGIYPGRVTWVHDAKVANWDEKNGFWWEDAVTSQAEADKMMNRTLLELTGDKELTKAWNDLFVFFNKAHKQVSIGYQPQQKIAIKINENNNSSHANCNEINASPQITLALLRTLIKDAKVPQQNITVFDASRFITDNIYSKCHQEFPNVCFVDNIGGDGRVKSTYVERAIPYSLDNGKLATGLASCAVDADYLINVALLKGHVGQGVTLCAKNYYGVTSIENDWRKNAHNNFDQNREGLSKYMTFVDFLGHKDLGEKTMLFLVDALYGAKLVNGVPAPKWKMAPFNNNWPCSLFASQDGVAIDAVCLDFLRCEWPDLADIAFSDQYLIESAQADNPPSKTFYDPEKDGKKLSSLGVMEHWNNPEKKQYSRNLGKPQGIELIYKPVP